MSIRTLAALGLALAAAAPGVATAEGNVAPLGADGDAVHAVDGKTGRPMWVRLLARPPAVERQPPERPASRFHQPWTDDVPVWREESYCNPAPFSVMHALPAS